MPSTFSLSNSGTAIAEWTACAMMLCCARKRGSFAASLVITDAFSASTLFKMVCDSANDPLALSQTILKSVLAENASVITSDAANDPRFLAQHSIIAHAVHSAMAVPLFDNEKVLGILYADSSDPLVNYGQRE